MKEIDANQLIQYARTWLGTPWVHNQCCLGHGVDCIRFVMECYSHFGAYPGEYDNYDRQPRANSLINYLSGLPSTFLVGEKEGIAPGQLLVLKVKKIPHHVAIATSKGTMIHADSSSYVKRVVEQDLDRWEHRIAARFIVKV